MPDLLVALYNLPPRAEGEGRIGDVVIRRANTFELSRVRRFIGEHFSEQWADEMAATFGRQPVTGYIAVDDGRVVGFAAYDATRRAFFGPMGVAYSHRGRGLGKALLTAAMWGLADLGYVYAIIGAAGPSAFYEKTVGAIPIPNSWPGTYTDLLRKDT